LTIQSLIQDQPEKFIKKKIFLTFLKSESLSINRLGGKVSPNITTLGLKQGGGFSALNTIEEEEGEECFLASFNISAVMGESGGKGEKIQALDR
jgi:hypothetical protein